MRYYPLFLAVEKRPSIVVGGGRVGERKVTALLSAGAGVTVIGPKVTEKLKELIDNKTIKHLRRAFRAGDLEGASVVISATGSKAVNKKVFEEARALRIPINVVDDPGLSTFITPATIKRGDLTIAVSTGGKCPALSKKLRKEMERAYGDEYGVTLEIAGAVRRRLLKNRVKSDKNFKIINALLASPLPRWIKEGDGAAIDLFLICLMGRGCTLKSLGVKGLPFGEEEGGEGMAGLKKKKTGRG